MAILTSEQIDENEADESDNSHAIHAQYVEEIKYYEQKAAAWEEKGNKTIRRYKDDRTPREAKIGRFNILWSNIQTLMPALYSRTPKPDVERRFRDKDDVGRVTGQVLERSITFFINQQFDNAVKQAVLDLLLPGRGMVWVRYEPKFKDANFNENKEVADEGLQITDDTETGDYDDGDDPLQEISDELICYDYVHWQDFGHNNARTWEEVNIVWRKVYMSRPEMTERFGKDKTDKVPLDYSWKGIKGEKIETGIQKAVIYEIWDKCESRVVWIHKDLPEPLDTKDDPLHLSGFFPCPQPLYATLANDDLLPVSDYREYQDQAIELDDLTSRIMAMTRAIKAAGVYDSSVQGLSRLLAEGTENTLIPVDQWALLGEKGGLQGVMQLLPMQEIAQTLLNLYDARDKVKSDLYEITGMSDVIRGTSDYRETAAAQEIKSKFGSLRLSARQDEVMRFTRDLVKIGAEIIAQHFQLETLKKISGVQLLTAQEKQLLEMKAANPQMAVLQIAPQLAKIDPETLEELMGQPTWEDVGELLKNEPMLAYKVDIETDSTIKFDQDAERAARVEFLSAVGGFLREAMKVEQPEMQPLLAKMLMFGVRGFKVGKELESSFETAISKLDKAAQNPQTKPDKDTMKLQADMQLKQMDMQFKQKLAEQEAQAEQARLTAQALVDKNQAQLDSQLQQQKMQNETQLKAIEEQNKMAIAKLDAETKIIIAKIQAKTVLGPDSNILTAGLVDDKAEMVNLMSQVVQQLEQTFAGHLGNMSNNMQQAYNGVLQSHDNLRNELNRPKQVIRDENGNIVGVH